MYAKKLSSMGYEKINELNDKYNISHYEITNMEEFEEFYASFALTYMNSDVILSDDMDYLCDLEERLHG